MPSAAIDLDGPYVRAATTVPRARPTFTIARTSWDLYAPPADLPEQLRPYQTGRVEADAPPRSGQWAAGAVLWNRATPPAPLGWLCVAAGTPGTWANVTTPLAVG